jgi:hypothetical protein
MLAPMADAVKQSRCRCWEAPIQLRPHMSTITAFLSRDAKLVHHLIISQAGRRPDPMARASDEEI